MAPVEGTAKARDSAREELAQIYEAELDYVWRTLARLGVRDADCADAAHEVFLVVHRRLPDFDRSRPVRPWLFGIAYRVALGMRRRASGNEVLGAATDTPSSARGPEDRAAMGQRWQLALRALDMIPLERRTVFIMHLVDGISVVEIARVLEIPLNTAYSRLRLAKVDFDRAVDRLQPSHG
ncbi:MAG: RNA polymerase sigma factor [Sandaracinaceae bacterium]